MALQVLLTQLITWQVIDHLQNSGTYATTRTLVKSCWAAVQLMQLYTTHSLQLMLAQVRHNKGFLQG